MNKKSQRILFFVPQWPASNSGVLHSQVLSMAKFLSEQGCECMFIGCDVTDAKAIEIEKKITTTYGIQAKVYGTYSNWMGYPGLVFTSWKLYKISYEVVRRFNPTHIYTREVISSKYARKIAKKMNAISVFDVRAALNEEILMRRGGRKGLSSWYIRKLEFREFRESQRLACVSENLKSYITAHVGRKDITVIPSCLDSNKFHYDSRERAELRALYSFTDENKVIIYSGGLAVWQRINDVISLFEAISKFDQTYRFIFLTHDSHLLENMLIKSNLESDEYIIESCSQDEVYRYLSAADAGVILRQDTIVNNVASPIKIGEYLGCGLPLILTKGIGDYSDLIPKSGVGLLLDESHELAEQVISYMKQLKTESVREKSIGFSKKYFLADAYINKYEKLYS